MTSTSKLFRGVFAAIFSVLILAPFASALDFDSSSGQSMPAIVRGLDGQNKSLYAPTPSTTTVSSELALFWENLKDDTRDKICKSIEIKLNEEGKIDNIVGIGGKFNRYLRRSADNRIFLLDDVGLSLSLGLGTDVLSIPNIGPLGVSLTGVLAGDSQVVQPLETDDMCKAMGTFELAKLYKVKVVIPAKAERITAMKVGEIWKMPLVMRLGFGASVGATISEVVNVSVSAGMSKESKPSVTLNRLAQDKLRLRLRLDRVTVKSVGASVSTVEIPLADVGFIGGESAIASTINNAANKGLASQINKYLALKLSYGYSHFTGKKLLLEFILNPENPEQMASLEKFLQGDFGVVKRFIELGLRFNTFSDTDETTTGLGEIAGAAEQAGHALHADSSFAGTDMYNGHSHNVNVNIPIIHSHQSSWTSSYNRYQSMDNNGETLHVHQQSKVSNGSSVDIPFYGTMVKYDSNRNVYVVNRESKDGSVTRPVFMYQQYEGFVRQGDGTARDMLGHANGVLRYVGTHGDGVYPGNVVPANAIFPALPEETDSDGFPSQPSKTYRAAMMSFKLLINEHGVQDIIFAPAQAIMKAYMSVMRETEYEVVSKVMDLFTIGADGKVGYDRKAMEKRLGVSSFDNEDGGTNPMDVVQTLAYAATKVIADITSVKDAGNWKDQSEKFAKVAAGSSKSGLKYEDFLKVVVQLVKPSDVSAEVFVHTEKRVKGEADVTQNYQFFNNRENSFDDTIADVNQMHERFSDPAELTD